MSFLETAPVMATCLMIPGVIAFLIYGETLDGVDS